MIFGKALRKLRRQKMTATEKAALRYEQLRGRSLASESGGALNDDLYISAQESQEVHKPLGGKPR